MPMLRDLAVFVNDDTFAPYAMRGDPGPEIVQQVQERTERFWRQLISLEPFAFLASGTALTCVLKDEKLFHRVLLAAEGLAQVPGKE